MVWRARLSWRSPPRLRRWRVVRPLEAGSGATPASRAKAASEPTRPRCDQVTISWAATIGPMPGSSSSSGRARARGRGSRVRARRLRRSRPGCGGRASAARGSSRAGRVCASSSGGSGCSGRGARRAAAGAARGGVLRCGDDHAAQLDERDAARRRRRFGGPAAAAVAPPAARRLAARDRCSLASAERAARTASSGSSLPRSRRSLRLVRLDLVHQLAAGAEIADKPGAVVAGALDRPDTHRPARAGRRSGRRPRSRARSRPPIAPRSRRRSARRRSRARAGRDGCRRRPRSPVRLQASRLILRLVGSGTPVWSRETARQVCNESRPEADKLLIKPTAGARPASPCTPGQIHCQDTQQAARRLKSHERHGRHQTGNGP